MGFNAYNPASVPYRHMTRPGKITNSAGVELDPSLTGSDRMDYLNAGNGGYWYFYLFCTGAETKLDIQIYKESASGIFDLYINGTLDSSTYDMYSAGGALYGATVTLTVKPNPGLNIVTFKINSKNGASTGYALSVLGVRLR